MLISLIICTYNRWESLNDTLASLLNQDSRGNFDYEIIVVDNNSRDKTKAIIENYRSKFSVPLRYVFEPRQGLSFARNRGIKEAQGEIIAFTDDDCLPEREWLLKIWQKFTEDDSLDVILGNAVWEDGQPMFGEDEKLKCLGLNMSFKAQTLRTLNGFDTYLGSGSIGFSCEDRDIIYKAQRRNKKVVFCKDIVVVHKHRINYDEVLKIARRDCSGRMILELKYFIQEGDVPALKNAYWLMTGTIAALVAALRARNKEMASLKLAQLSGVGVGLVRGLYIWLILKPSERILMRI